MSIGLVGYSANNGLGELARQSVRYCPAITKWRIRPHKTLGHSLPERPIDYDVSSTGVPARFFNGIDTVLFFEGEFYPGLAKAAKAAGKRIVCVPMIEWTPMWSTRADPNAWIGDVDLFICPTKQCYDLLKADGFPCVYFPWPFDVERFAYRERMVCNRFLFIEGNGGYRGRKGGETVRRAKQLWPEMPLVVHTLLPPGQHDWPDGTEIIQGGRDNNLSVYDHGDVLIYPATCDGIGLQPYEAMAQGMPVIVTRGEPWDENDAMSRIGSRVERYTSGKGRQIPWYVAKPEALVEICKAKVGQHIGRESQLAFECASQRTWSQCAAEFQRLVTSGNPG